MMSSTPTLTSPHPRPEICAPDRPVANDTPGRHRLATQELSPRRPAGRALAAPLLAPGLLALGLLALLIAPVGTTLAQAPRTTGKPEASASAGTSAGLLPGKPLAGGWRLLSWDDLMPPDWDPLKLLENRGISALNDSDPRAIALLQELREQWDKAPTRPELDGMKIRLPGYVVPLDMLGGEIREFLLVPYLGACIHTPPPPANQIIHAVSARRHTLQTMDAIWINGTLKIARSDTSMGVSGYQLEINRVEPYREPPR